MTSSSIVAFAAAVLSSVLAIAVVLRRRSLPAWFFAAGMVVLAGESFLGGLSLSETDPGKLEHWHRDVLLTKSLIPFFWIAFSVTYLRGDYRSHLRQWRAPLVAALVIPVGLAAGFRDSLAHVHPRRGGGWWIEYSSVSAALNIAVLLATIIILMNLEKTLRAAAGTARWKVKFAMLGLGVIFGARVYTRSQSLLFSGFDLSLTVIETSALLVGCVLMMVALIRQGFGVIDIYPSRAVLQSSVTLLLAGGYLFVVGVLAQLAATLGGAESFQFQAVIVLAGVAVLAVILFSDRLRQRLRSFVGRHFRRPQHDSLRLWSSFTHRLSSAPDARTCCAAAVKLTAESFHVLSVTIWLHDERKDSLSPGASTAAGESSSPLSSLSPAAPVLEGLRSDNRPFDLDGSSGPAWADSLRTASQPHFRKGGGRLCVPLVAADRALGAMILVDRVNGVSYTTEEFDLLRCIGDQIAAGLLQFQLTEELMQGREMEAFQTMATFFVHDLKNAASSLGLMLENLPVHFDDPAFRQDALRGIGTTVNRINHIISRLGTLRQKPELKTVETDLNHLMAAAMDGLGDQPGIEMVRDLQPLPPVMADREQMESVITNLLINAREAMENGGKISVRTARQDGRALISVADTGCGMSPGFIRDSLFRPFCSTKKKGLGIGMFQCRVIIHAHRGSIQVESQPGHGSTFLVYLPLKPGTP